jgi:hypothetical protein
MNINSILNRFVPDDISSSILEFSGFHKLRNGQFMKQIDKTTRGYRRIKKCVDSKDLTKTYAVLNLSKNTKVVMFNQFANKHGRL